MKRRLFKLGVFLLLGVVVNVAVAWGCCKWQLPEPRWSYSDHRGSQWLRPVPGDWPAPWRPEIEGRSFGWRFLQFRSNLPGWSGKPDPSSATFVAQDVIACGWPFQAMYTVRNWMRPDAASSIFVGTTEGQSWCQRGIPAGTSPYSHLRSYLPLATLWPGFAADTIFYATFLGEGWLLFGVPGFIRRRRRLKRGLCPACAYPVGASTTCAECGRSVTPRST